MRAIVLSIAAVAVTVTVVSVALTRGQHRNVGGAQTSAARTEVATLHIPEMFCSGCEIGVKIAANNIDGVKNAKTDADTRTADVIFDPTKTTPQAVASAITKGTGFEAEVCERHVRTHRLRHAAGEAGESTDRSSGTIGQSSPQADHDRHITDDDGPGER